MLANSEKNFLQNRIKVLLYQWNFTQQMKCSDVEFMLLTNRTTADC